MEPRAGRGKEGTSSWRGRTISDGGVLPSACGCMPEHLALPAIGMRCVPGSRTHLRNRVSSYKQCLVANPPLSRDKSWGPTEGFCFRGPSGRQIFRCVYAPWGWASCTPLCLALLSPLKSPPSGQKVLGYPVLPSLEVTSRGLVLYMTHSFQQGSPASLWAEDWWNLVESSHRV